MRLNTTASNSLSAQKTRAIIPLPSTVKQQDARAACKKCFEYYLLTYRFLLFYGLALFYLIDIW